MPQLLIAMEVLKEVAVVEILKELVLISKLQENKIAHIF
jgi:hypothetical protein